MVDKIESKDKNLKIDLREDNKKSKEDEKYKKKSLVHLGVKKFFDQIDEDYPNLENVVFNGKTIASWIFQYEDPNKKTITVSPKYLDKKFSAVEPQNKSIYYYPFELKIKNKTKTKTKTKNITAMVLPNTSGLNSTYTDDPWIDFWKSIKSN